MTDQPLAEPPEGTVTAPSGLERPPHGKGMFGVAGPGDTSGFGGLVRHIGSSGSSERPYGGYFDEVVDELAAALHTAGLDPDQVIERVVVERGELTLHIRPEDIREACQRLRDEPNLRFELCSSVSGVDYLDANPDDPARTVRRAMDLRQLLGVAPALAASEGPQVIIGGIGRVPEGMKAPAEAIVQPRREAQRAARRAALHHQLVALRGLEERRQLRRDLGDQLRRGAHDPEPA